jgi:hypothetical protein
LQVAVHVLPHAYRNVAVRPGLSIGIRITGRASGAWTLHGRAGSWDIEEDDRADATATVTMSDEIAWRLFFNALSQCEAESAVRVDGDADLARPLLHARAVIL